jgi:hypothetical protein
MWLRRTSALCAGVLVLSLAALPPGSAQEAGPDQDRYLIELRNRSFVPEPGIEAEAIREAQQGEPEEQVHFLLQLRELVDARARKGIEGDLGVRLLQYVDGQAYLASMPADQLEQLTSDHVRWAGPLRAEDKTSSELAAGEIGRWAQLDDGRVVLTFQLHEDTDPADARVLIDEHDGEPLSFLPASDTYTAAFAPSAVAGLAAEGDVLTLDVAAPRLEDQNDGAQAAAGVAPLRTAPYGLSGAGVNVLVYDSGRIDPNHPDFAGRIVSQDASNVRRHSTHVGGTVGGDGSNSNGNDSAGNANGGTAGQWAGMAPATGLHTYGSQGSTTDVFYDDGGDLNGDFTTALGLGTDLATVSQGNNVVPNGFPCAQLGDYTNVAILLDDIIRGSISGQQLIYFNAAGNERRATGGCGQSAVISSPATSKNAIVVGAINSDDNSMTGFSSWGPTDDGRVKPDITAPGCQNGGDGGLTAPAFLDADGDGNLDAGETTNAYVSLCGTSMATPTSAGATALLIEQWRSTRGAASRPLPHTVKALLTHSSTDLGAVGPDYAFGFGALNAQAAVDVVRADDLGDLVHVDAVDQGDTTTLSFGNDGVTPVRVTLAWDDPAATRLAATTLVNDLDVRLVDPDGITYTPWVLDPANPTNAAVAGDDATNNVEMIDAPAKAGAWTVTVEGGAVPTGPQQYTLVTPVHAGVNAPPTAEAGGPYSTAEGTDVLLDASSSSDPEGGLSSYEWDLDGDGQFDDATGATTTFDRVGQDDVHTVAVRVTDSGGLSDTDSTTVTVANVAPDVLLAIAAADEGSAVQLNALVQDPGWLDPLTATVDWGDGGPVQAPSGALENDRPDSTLEAVASHVYGDNGSFDVQVCGADDDVTTCRTSMAIVTNVVPTAAIDTSGTTVVNGVPYLLAEAGVPVAFSGRSTDPGSDDLSLSWDWDDGAPAPDVTTVSLVNPPAADGTPSPSVQPRDVTDLQTHVFGGACRYDVGFGSVDDDGGAASDDLTVLVVGRADRVRSAGYWQQIYRGRKSEFTAADLLCRLDIVGALSAVFSEVRPASTVPQAYEVLNPAGNGGVPSEALDRQLLAAWLNFSNGGVGWAELLDTDGDGLLDSSFADLVQTAEAVRLDPASTPLELLEQKDRLERLNTRDG